MEMENGTTRTQDKPNHKTRQTKNNFYTRLTVKCSFGAKYFFEMYHFFIQIQSSISKYAPSICYSIDKIQALAT